MVGWHHRLDGHEFEQAPGDGEGQGSLACCSPWVCKELDITERLNNNRRGSKRLKRSVCGGGEQLGPATDSADCALISTLLFLTLRSPVLSGFHFPKLLCSKACPGDRVLANQI